MRVRSSRWIAIFAMLALLCTAAQAAPEKKAPALKDEAALAGLQSAKGLFLIAVNDPGRVAHVLDVVEKTRKGMIDQNVKPELVVVFVGPDVAFLTRDRRGISYMDQRAVSGIQGNIEKLAKSGVHFEACGIAMHGMDVKPADLIPQVTAVGNGYISAIGYQNRGYGLVPVY